MTTIKHNILYALAVPATLLAVLVIALVIEMAF